MLQFDPQVLKYLPADRLAEHLKQLHPGMAVTHGRHESLALHQRLGMEFLRRAAPPVRSRYLSWLIQGDDRQVFLDQRGALGKSADLHAGLTAKIADRILYQSMTVLGIS
jgi:hypothetical protein